jgi:hypothetical protein
MQKVMKILLGAGVTAASMYYLNGSHGPDRRASARARLDQWRNGAQEKLSAIGRTSGRAAQNSEEFTDPLSGNGADQFRNQDSLQDRPL